MGAYIITAAAAMLISTAAAGNAPAVTGNPSGVQYVANIPGSATTISGAVKGAAAPSGDGTSFQVAFYNLPGGNITYGIYTGRVGKNADCSLAGSILNPFQGVSGSSCTSNNEQACEIGDLSDKHGSAYIQSGGAGTGYFAADYVDAYLSVDSSSKSFFGSGSIVVMNEAGTALACADFVNANAPTSSSSSSGSGSQPTGTSTQATTMSVSTTGVTGTATTSPTSSATSKSTNGADRPVAAGLVIALFALAALMF